MTQDPLPQKGVTIGLSVDPLAKSKNKYLKGLNFRFNYVNVHDDDNREGGDNGQLRVRNRTRTNRATIFSMSTRGRHSYIEPSIDYRVGPFNFGYVWSRQVGEQRRTGGCAAREGFDEEADALDESGALFVPADLMSVTSGDVAIAERTSAEEDQADLRVAEAAACNNFSDARITNNLISVGAYVWGPKGFMSGSRNGGWRLTYTHNRLYMDAGSGWNAGEGGEPLGSAETENEFDFMRRWHMIENIILLRWYKHRNVTFAIQYDINSISKMKGTARAADTRRRLGILEDGGTYQQITFHTKWSF